MSILHLIGHAESEANRQRILASRQPFPLSSAGREDACRIASELRELTHLDRIISSPLLRAIQTAEFIRDAYRTISIDTDERIAEQHLGDFSGMGYDEVKLQQDYEKNTMNRWNWVPRGGGESYSMIAQRVQSFFLDIAKAEPGNRILVVTHAVVFRLIRGILENTLPEYKAKFPNNGEIWKIDFTGTGKVYPIESLYLGNSRSFTHNP